MGFLNESNGFAGQRIYTSAKDNGKGKPISEVELRGVVQDKSRLVDGLATFAGKIKSDLTIPHLSKYLQNGTIATTKGFSVNEFNQSYIDTLSVVGTSQIAGFTGSSNNFQTEFIMDMLYTRRLTENKPAMTANEMISKTKALTVKFYGTFQGDNGGKTGFGTIIRIFNHTTNKWDVLEDNTKPYTMFEKTLTENLYQYFDTNGKVYINAYSKYNSSTAISGVATFEYVTVNAQIEENYTVNVSVDEKGLATKDESLYNKVEDIEKKLDLILDAKTTIKTKAIEDYALNIHHLEDFKKAAALETQRRIVPVSMVGDSITEGGSTTNFLNNGYASIVRDVLKSKYLGAGAGMITGWRRVTATPTYAWTRTGTWSDGSSTILMPPAATGQITIQGTGFRLWYLKGTNAGTFQVQVDGGTAVEVNANQTTVEVAEYEIKGLTNASHTVKVINNDAAKNMYLIGIIETDRTSGIRFDNFGWWGRMSSLLANNDFFNIVTREDPLLTVVALTANDFSGMTNLWTYKNNLQKLIDNVKSKGNYIVLFANGLRQTNNEAVAQDYYELAMRELAIDNDIAFISWNSKYDNDYSKLSAVSPTLMSDGVHPNDAGHKDMAKVILKHLF